jgi:hypothetical protein
MPIVSMLLAFQSAVFEYRVQESRKGTGIMEAKPLSLVLGLIQCDRTGLAAFVLLEGRASFSEHAVCQMGIDRDRGVVLDSVRRLRDLQPSAELPTPISRPRKQALPTHQPCKTLPRLSVLE